MLRKSYHINKQKRQATISKNELARDYLQVCQHNQIKYKYVLADSWFSSKENMNWIHQRLNKHFVMALKTNRTVALSKEEKQQGRFIRIDSLSWSEQAPQLECLSLKHKMNHFALRSRIYIQVLQHAMFELQSLKSA
jgi:hypothetical protein